MVKTTTSSTLEGYEITEYHKPIFFQTVVGMNVISDFLSGWTDFFGGQSGRYKEAMAKYTALVLREMEAKCTALGGNYIIDFKIDFDDVSGQGKSMLMVSGSGTAVTVRKIKTTEPRQAKTTEAITGAEMQNKIQHLLWLENYKNADYAENIEYATQTAATELIDYIFRKYVEQRKIANENKTGLTEKVYDYFAAIPKQSATEYLYKQLMQIGEQSKTATEIIEALQYGSFTTAHQWLQSEEIDTRKAALKLMQCEISDYSEVTTEQIAQYINTLSTAFPALSEVKEEKALFNTTSRRWTCTCNSKNDGSRTYCFNCGNNIYGFREGELTHKQVIKLMEMRKQIIETTQSTTVSDNSANTVTTQNP